MLFECAASVSLASSELCARLRVSLSSLLLSHVLSHVFEMSLVEPEAAAAPNPIPAPAPEGTATLFPSHSSEKTRHTRALLQA